MLIISFNLVLSRCEFEVLAFSDWVWVELETCSVGRGVSPCWGQEEHN